MMHRVLAKNLEIPWAVLQNFTLSFGDPQVTIPTPISVWRRRCWPHVSYIIFPPHLIPLHLVKVRKFFSVPLRIFLTSKTPCVIPVTRTTLIYSRSFEDGTVATNEFSNYTAAKMLLKLSRPRLIQRLRGVPCWKAYIMICFYTAVTITYLGTVGTPGLPSPWITCFISLLFNFSAENDYCH